MLGEKTVIDGFKCFGAFGDDDDIGPGFFLDRFSEPSYGEKFVFVYHAFVTGEKNREGRSYESMLIGIVEQDDVDVRSPFRQFAYASAPVGIDGNRYGGNLCFICNGSSPTSVAVEDMETSLNPRVWRL